MSSRTDRFVLRPAELCDAAAIADLWNRRAALLGQPNVYTSTDVEHRWSTPGFNVATDTRLPWDGTTLVGYGHLRDVKEPHVDLFVSVVLDPKVENDDRLSDELFAWLDARGGKAFREPRRGLAQSSSRERTRTSAVTRSF